MKNNLLVCIPTYNERENVPLLYRELKKLPVNFDILFCDDNSPDGTGKMVDELAVRDATVKVMHRPGKLGLGTAHLACFEYARQHGYEKVLMMDADFTHDPIYIPKMIKASEHADLVIGSRYARGGGMEGWGKLRLPLTYFWKGMIKYGLGLPQDATGAFRLYRTKLLTDDLLGKVVSRQFSFHIEVLYFLKEQGARVVEVPIVAKNRVRGASKLSGELMREEARVFFRLLRHRIRRALGYT